MRMIKVPSGYLNAFGYDPDSKVLRIIFPAGEYIHVDIPQNIYDGLLTAHSKDFFYRRHITQYPIRKEN